MSTHIYRAACSWKGSTGVGYEHYSREHLAVTVPPTEIMALSADAAFRGDSALLNPEQLVVIAASSCQLLSFLAVAARARVDVIEYRDEAEGMMSENDDPTRLTRIILRPHITVKGKLNEVAVQRLVRLAHRECYIANSLRTWIEVHPEIRIDNL